MKIYGKSLSEIFGEMPLPYKIVVIAGGVFLFYIAIHFATMAVKSHQNTSLAGPLKINNGLPVNILDPSLAASTLGKDVRLAYADIDKAQSGTGGGISISIAESSAPCSKWTKGNKIFEARKEDLLAPDGQSVLTSGIWRYETPGIVFDAKDTGREWKIFAYKYFWANDTRFAKRYGAIVYKYAPATDANNWSTEEWMMAAAPDYPPMPYQGLVQEHLSNISPALAPFVAYSRPSVIVAGENLLMTLSAYTASSNTPERVILFVSADHGKNWAYLGAPLTQADASRLGDYNKLGGASLFISDNKIYLAAVFGNDKTAGEGTHVFGFSNLSAGELCRDQAGAPTIIKKIPLQSAAPTPTGGGYATSVDACEQGILTSEQSGLTGGFPDFHDISEPYSLFRINPE